MCGFLISFSGLKNLFDIGNVIFIVGQNVITDKTINNKMPNAVAFLPCTRNICCSFISYLNNTRISKENLFSKTLSENHNDF